MWEKDSTVRSYALSMWANHIETGSVSTSVNDLKNSGREQDIKRLEPNQVQFVERLRGLAKHELFGDSVLQQIEDRAATQPFVHPGPEGVWTLESGLHTCRVGKVKVVQISCICGEGESDLFIAQGFMPSIATDLGQHKSFEEAQAYADRAIRAWIKALLGIAA